MNAASQIKLKEVLHSGWVIVSFALPWCQVADFDEDKENAIYALKQRLDGKDLDEHRTHLLMHRF